MTKKTALFVILPAAFAMMAILTGFSAHDKTSGMMNSHQDNLVIPEDVNEILDNKCFGCHNVDAKSDKAKEKLLLDELSTLSKAKMVAKLNDIHEVVEEGEMPPAKFLEKYPDKALTDEEATLLKNWAQKTVDELMGQ